MQCFQNSSVFASKEKNKEQITTCGVSKQLSSCHLKNGKFAYLHQDTTDWTLVLLGYFRGRAAMAQRCHPRQCTLRIYLWEGFWNGFLLGQACEVPATARGNHFRPFVCLDSLDMLICCTGTGLLVEEPKMAKTVSADRIITEIHWHWVVPAPPGHLAGFNLSQPTNTVSIISKTFEDYQILSNNTRGIL